MKLEELLARIYDATQHTKPMGAHRTITTWFLQKEPIKVREKVAPEVKKIPYPAFWAGTAWDPDKNIKWDEGQWDALK